MIKLEDVRIISVLAEKFGSEVGERYLTAIANFNSGKIFGPQGKPRIRKTVEKEIHSFEFGSQVEKEIHSFEFGSHFMGGMGISNIDVATIKKINSNLAITYARDADQVKWIRECRAVTNLGLSEAKHLSDSLRKNTGAQALPY